MNASEAKERVLVVWPDAWCEGGYRLFFIWKSRTDCLMPVGSGLCEDDAWIDAASRLLEEKEPAPKEGEKTGWCGECYQPLTTTHLSSCSLAAKPESGDGLPRGVQRINSAVSAIDAMKAKNPLVSDNDAAIVFHEKWQSALEDNERLRGLLRDCEDAATVLAYERATDITGKHYSELSKKIKAAVTGEQP